jgi:hypothetical protein
MTDEPAGTPTRPLNPIAALTLVLVFPYQTFSRLRERPHWITPLVFVAASAMLSAVFAVRGGYMDTFLGGMAFRSGADPETVGSAFVASGVVMALVGVPLVTLLEALFFRLAGSLAGGVSRFKVVFAAVAYASVPAGIGALSFAILLPITKDVETGANLAFLVEPAANPFVWSLLRQVDLFLIWSFVLLAIAAEPVLGLERQKARLATLAFALFYVLVMSWWGMSTAGQFIDPYAGWPSRDVGGSAMHFRGSTPEPVLDEMEDAILRAEARAGEVLGLGDRNRIDYYVYPSVGEKRLITDNPAAAHRVEWANAVHVARAEGIEVSLTREVTKLLGANASGNVYNPFIRDGLAVYAGGEWAGMAVAAAGADLHERKVLPRLETLIEPALYASLDERQSQPAAGSFASFAVAELGPEGLKGLAAATSSRPAAAGEVLEASFGDSLPGIERRWTAFLESVSPGVEPVPDRASADETTKDR